MSFVKGNIPWSKGTKLVPQKIENINCSCGCGGNLNRYDSRNRERIYLRFHARSFILGNPKYYTTHKGHKHSETSKQKISENRKGLTAREKNPAWKGGITSQSRIIRASNAYKIWRATVFERDNYTCQFCGVRGGILNADHIKPFSQYPELRLDISNGRTLCVLCHKKTDSYGGKIKNNKRIV